MREVFSSFARIETAGVIYHCIPVTPEGEAIRPSDNYGMTIPADVRNRLGMPPEGNTPLVFASAHITKAMAFGLQGNLQEKLRNGSITGSDGEMVLACDREKLMARKRDITIYEFSGRDFVTLEHADRQCVSTKPVPFAAAKVAFRATSAEDLMRGGLQILAFNETFAELRGSDFVSETMKKRGYDDFNRFLGEMVREGKLIWENRERGINPDPVLAKNIGVELIPASRAAAPNRPKR